MQFLTKDLLPGNFTATDELKSLIEAVLTKVQIKGRLFVLDWRNPIPLHVSFI